jgi:subtilase family protein
MTGRRIVTLLAAAGVAVSAAPAVAGQSAKPLADDQPPVALELKFQEALDVRGADEQLRSAAGEDLGRVDAVLSRYRAQEIAPLVQSLTAEQLDGLAAGARARTGRPAPDMASWYLLTLPAGVDVDAAIADLRALPEVTHAYPAPDAAPPPQSSTPDFTAMQGYLRPAPVGIDADFSHQDPRTRGAGIRVVDLEYDWNPFHEDLGLDWSTDLGGDVFPRYTGFADEHGTAVFGELVGADNAYGVTGGVPEAQMLGISPTRRVSPTQTRWLPGEAMVYAGQFLDPGDALLIEQQTVGPNGGTRYVPVEWIQSAFDATRLLTDLGVTVVATGGNGGENLDGPEFLGRFDRTVRDSGAIVVGAGSSTTHERLSFSVYGSRVDLQGWGHNITTTGGNGNLQGGTDPANRDVRYTRTFGGTSGAGPIVTSAVVAVQSYRKATGQAPWSAARIAELLKRNGTPQGGDTSQHIGPLPDVELALKEIEVDPPETTATVEPAGGWWSVDSRVTLTAEDGWGHGIDRIRYRLDGGAWRTYDDPFRVRGAGRHTVAYRAIDLNGNAEEVEITRFRNRG